MRLAHSRNGFLRTLQMSRARLHVFVEGRDLDPYVYGRVIELECPGLFDYALFRADQLPGAARGGGKQALLGAFDFLRRRGRLSHAFHGHRYTTVFLLDKDIDDVLRTRKRSLHVVYTPTYDLEGVVFRNADLADAVAATCNLDPQLARAKFPDTHAWCKAASVLWFDWVALCVTSRQLRANCEANYSVPSRVNPVASQPADPSAVAMHTSTLESASGLPTPLFARRLRATHRLVRGRYATGTADALFKGKWYGEILDDEMRGQFPLEHARTAAFKARITSSLAQTLDYSAAWSWHFRTPVRNLLAVLP